MLLLSLLLACDPATPESTSSLAASAPDTLQLVYSGNVHGEIESCG